MTLSVDSAVSHELEFCPSRIASYKEPIGETYEPQIVELPEEPSCIPYVNSPQIVELPEEPSCVPFVNSPQIVELPEEPSCLHLENSRQIVELSHSYVEQVVPEPPAVVPHISDFRTNIESQQLLSQSSVHFIEDIAMESSAVDCNTEQLPSLFNVSASPSTDTVANPNFCTKCFAVKAAVITPEEMFTNGTHEGSSGNSTI